MLGLNMVSGSRGGVNQSRSDDFQTNPFNKMNSIIHKNLDVDAATRVCTLQVFKLGDPIDAYFFI